MCVGCQCDTCSPTYSIYVLVKHCGRIDRFLQFIPITRTFDEAKEEARRIVAGMTGAPLDRCEVE